MGFIITTRRKVNGRNQNATAVLHNESLASYHSKYAVCDRFTNLLGNLDDTTWITHNKKVLSAQYVDDEAIGDNNFVATVDLVMNNIDVPNMAKTVMVRLEGITEDNFVDELDEYIESLTDNISESIVYNHTDFIVTNAIFNIE